MGPLTAGFDPTPLVDAILAIVLVEALVWAAWRRRTRRGPPMAAVLANLAAGLFLLLAVRAALVGASPALLLGFVTAAGAAHLVDVLGRLR